MTSSATIKLEIGNAIPAGNEHETAAFLALWQEIGDFFRQRPFTARTGRNGDSGRFRVTLDANSLVNALEAARSQSETLTGHQLARVEDPGTAIDATLVLDIAREDGGLDEEASYHVATVFFQDLVMAAHIARPGSIQILDARFSGAGAHRYEAQSFDSELPYGALKAAADHGWPELRAPAFEAVWSWLEGSETSARDTAIKRINKALFTLLKITQQRDEHSARASLLVMYLLEVLLGCRRANSLKPLTQRIPMILGPIPDLADRLADLYEARNELFIGAHPVRRPPLIRRNRAGVLREQTGQYHSAVDAGLAIALALLQDLVAHGAYRYEFTETLTRS
ncbi:MAG: hypothetical protein RQ826_17380 [Xanthomonadales bacterium]|nr:hypothetical protein [Xanthomonadales bacterium]